MFKTINYGFGKEYLPKWTIKKALREIYQNFLDYGDYEEIVSYTDDHIAQVRITNSYVPEKLEFLRIGNSVKNGNKEAIGQHGEGLKMAFLIFLRNNYDIKIHTDKFTLYPCYIVDKQVGELFCIRYFEHKRENQSFTIEFDCDELTFNEYRDGIIKPEDIIFNYKYFGSIVNKPAGNIYSGRLFVCQLGNLTRAYDINPSSLPLDRDRAMPRSFDINYSTSKINQAYGKWSHVDTDYSDTMFITDIPEETKKKFKPIMVEKNIEFVTKNEEGKTVIVKNDSIKEALMKDSFFERIIKRFKRASSKDSTLYELLKEFEKKYVTSNMQADFDIILSKVKKK